MHVPIYPRPARCPRNSRTKAALPGTAEFDEKLKAPMVKEPAALRMQAQSYVTKFAALKEVAPEELIRNRAFESERFDLAWQIQHAIDARRPLGDLSAIGLTADENGAYRIDYNANPQWLSPGEFPSGWLPTVDWVGFGADLISRGFRPDDVAKLRSYVETHDAHKTDKQRSLPLAISFSRMVKKYDRIKRPVDDALVLSYLYQRTRIQSEAIREWAEGMLNSLDAQRGRILLAYFEEMTSTGVWAPSDQRAGVDGLLGLMRLPNYEQLAAAEVAGGQS